MYIISVCKWHCLYPQDCILIWIYRMQINYITLHCCCIKRYYNKLTLFSPHSNGSKIFYQSGDDDRIRWTADMVVYFGLFQLTDRNIGNSRDTTFEQLIMSETKGRGVDLVLNSLAEEKLQASVRCLAGRGRFLEIGKFDLNNNSRLGRLLFINLFHFYC